MAALLMRKIVITGVANGIGKATALACAKAGFFVIAADQSGKGLQELQALLPPHRLETHLVDLSQPEAYTSFISGLYGIYSHRALHALINNVGPYHDQRMDADAQYGTAAPGHVNLKSLTCLSKDFAQRELRAPHSRCIINITPQPLHTEHRSACCHETQAGVIDLTETNAWNFAPRVRVNAISPASGTKRTADSATVGGCAGHERIPLGQRHMLARHVGINPAAQPDGIADVIMFLLSEQSRHLTGKVIAVNHGADLC